jgi:transcription antitermination protein NusB
MGTRRKARECALQMLYAADAAKTVDNFPTAKFWENLEPDADEKTREFADKIVLGTLRELEAIDKHIRKRAEHWRIERMAIVDRNVLRLAVYEFLYTDTPATVVINEALEITRRFSSPEAPQFINGILDAIKFDLNQKNNQPPKNKGEKTHVSSS